MRFALDGVPHGAHIGSMQSGSVNDGKGKGAMMSKGKTEDAKYLLIKAKHESGEFFHITATVVTRSGDEVRCVTDGPLEDLTISSQGNDRYGTDRALYAWEVDYRSVYSVDLVQPGARR